MSAETAVDDHNNRFTQYVIQVVTEDGAGWELRRRYSQFAELHEQMKSLFSGLPKLPPKTMGNKLSPAVVTARQNSLEVYLDLLLDDSLTRRADPLFQFFQVDENSGPLAVNMDHEDDFAIDSTTSSKKRKKKRKKTKPPTDDEGDLELGEMATISVPEDETSNSTSGQEEECESNE